MLLFVYGAVTRTFGWGEKHRLPPVGFALVLALLFGSAALAVSASRSTRFAVRTFVVFTIALFAVGRYRADRLVDVVGHLSAILFTGWVCFLIARNVWSLRRADFEAIAAALCAFLMIGLFWSLVYSLVAIVDAGAFPPGVDMTTGGTDALTPLYFSFVTLTTLGYGDIFPVSPGARMFTVLEAITGQIFLVVLVARLVGLNIAAASASPGDADR